jgi:quinoprotein glucose dehydrogenase
VWPITERAVPQSDVPGERTSATQPFPPDALQYARNYLKVPDDLIDFTPELRQKALDDLKPPYGVLAAIDLDKGLLKWRTPHGDTPDQVRNHGALKGMEIPKTGQAQTQGVGLLVTKTLVIMGDPVATTTAEHPRGAMLRVYDKTSGQQVGAVFMPAAQSGNPMTYMSGGKQYIVVAVSGGSYSGEYIAFHLPD